MAPLQIERLPEEWRECRWHQNGNLFASILESHLPEVQGIIANLRRDATLKRVDLKTLATLREWRRAVSTALGSAMAYPYCDVPKNIERMKQERDAARDALIAIQEAARQVAIYAKASGGLGYRMYGLIDDMAALLPAAEGQTP